MNYQAIYDRLITRARGRLLVGYAEGHHVLPRCLHGMDHPENIVRLTAEEHYVAHQLLVKLYPGHLGIISAAHVMTTSKFPGRSNNKLYGWLRWRMSDAQTGQKRPPEVGKKIGDTLRGRKRDPEAVAKGAAKLRGSTWSDEAKARVAARPHVPRKMTPEQIEANRQRGLGKKQSPQTIAKRIAACQARYAITPKPKHTEEAKVRMRASRLAYVAKQVVDEAGQPRKVA